MKNRPFNTVANPKTKQAKQTAAEIETTLKQRQEKQLQSSASSDGNPWKEYTSRTTGKKYYYNTITKRTQWEKPPMTTDSIVRDVKADIAQGDTARASVRSTTVARSVPIFCFKTDALFSNEFARKTIQTEAIDPQKHTLRQPTTGNPQIILTVRLMDGTAKKFITTDDFTLQVHLLHSMFLSLNFKRTYYTLWPINWNSGKLNTLV
jgi:hypothetical protein